MNPARWASRSGMDTIDFTPATSALAGLLRATAEDQLGAPTPCPDYTVADLCDHIGGLTVAFTQAATKSAVPGGTEPSGDGSRLESGWRDRIAGDLDALAAAWTAPEAYTGLTQAGPIELPGEIAALVALNEVVVHGWDLAVATGQDFAVDPTLLETCRGFVASFEVPEGAAAGAGSAESDADLPFGRPVPVADDAPALDRLVAAAGRRPDWSA